MSLAGDMIDNGRRHVTFMSNINQCSASAKGSKDTKIALAVI